MFCELCNKEFEPTSNSAKYCGEECRRLGYEIAQQRNRRKQRLKYELKTRQYGKPLEDTMRELDELNKTNRYISYGKYMSKKEKEK